MDDVMPLSKKRNMDLIIKKKKRKMDDVMPLTHKKKNGIDQLPDELLILVLSFLSFHEAAKTCILSRRWRYLWKYTTCNIQFYNEDTKKFTAAEEFINSVNQVLKLHQAESLQQFKVGFAYPTIDYSPNRDTDFARERQVKVDHDIDCWINFAMEKQVKVIELNMAAGEEKNGGFWSNYNIPHVQKLLSISGEVKLMRTLSTLKSFRFVNIHITQEVVEFLLSRCPLLEHLCISASNSLNCLKVAGSLPKLRSVEISYCDFLETMKVHARGLVSFKYIGPAIKAPFKKVPLLSELFIGGYYADSFIFDAHKHQSYSRNLKKLKLEVSSELSKKCREVPNEHPQLCNLEELDLDIKLEEDDGLCFFTFLTKCSPRLSKLTIRLYFTMGMEKFIDLYKRQIPDTPDMIDQMRQQLEESRRADRAAREATTFCHKCLEVVKFVGFFGCSSDYNLALHLLRIAPSLKKMILNSQGDSNTIFLIDEKTLRKSAEQLKANLPPGAELLTYGPGFTTKLDDSE